jgi:hypothetical protein
MAFSIPEAPVRVYTNRKKMVVVREDTSHGTEINTKTIWSLTQIFAVRLF